MIGFPSVRTYQELPSGLGQQTILAATPEQVAFWDEVFPPEKPPLVVWDGMSVLLGPKRHRVTFQRVEERSQFLRTFNPAAVPVVKRPAPGVLVFTCEPVARAATPAPEEPGETSLESLTDPQLRTRAAELGLEPDPNQPRAILIELVKTAQAMAAAV